ncbi:MAG: signal peptidase I [Pseudomonadota bacterium]
MVSLNIGLILVVALVVMGAIWLMDVLIYSKKRGENVKEHVLIDISRSIFPVILVVLILRSFLFEPFKIPSGSMMPTLLVGDFIAVNKYAYGLRLPVTDTKILDVGEPQRGDVIVFRFPEDKSIDFIKRVIGLPGDVLEYKNKMLYVNGKPQPQQKLGVYEGVGSGKVETGDILFNEKLGEAEHRILVDPGHALRCPYLANGPVKVPPGNYFTMGDNRDNSRDSRCWGFVPEENLVGRASMIWMNLDWKREGFPIDWGRIGDSIN